MDEEIKTTEYVRRLLAEAIPGKEGFFIMKDDEEIIGWGNIRRYSDRIGYRFACETSVFLKSEHTGKGYGTRMKKFLMQKCREFGYHHIVNKIMAVNRVSVEYNKKLGFEIVGTQKEIGFKNGQWVDVVVMQYIIR